jgi:nucleoside-diphosphate-sugar epimerase
MRTLVTGASGFIGAAACAELLERGHEVTALVRRAGSEPAGTRAAVGDLGDESSMRAAIDQASAECVMHLAAQTGAQRSAAKIHAANVEGTQRLLAACEAAGRPRFVLTSTVVTGDAEGRVLWEDAPLPVETAYGRSKQECERLLRESSLDGVVVRPGHVYGAGGWFAHEFVARLRQPGRFAVIGSGENWWDVVHVADVAAALADAAERAPAGSVFHVADDEPITFYNFIALTAKALGVGRPRRIPAALARLVAGRDPVCTVTRSARTANARLKRELGWTPRFPTARLGVPAVVAELRAQS